MRLYDTRTRKVEEIHPATPRLLRLYACGPTVYRYAHVGNYRTFLLSDLIRRVADVVHGWQVRVVQNITDVGHLADDADIDPSGEDKVLAAARAEGKSSYDIARFYEDDFHANLAALNIHPAEEHPRATEWIGSMLELIGKLIELGYAYVGTDGTVFFDAQSFESYGALSGNRLDDLRPGHREDVEKLTAGKRFHADWALWKPAAGKREMVWDSPWGPGFPGWHTECSAMSLDLLGDVIDIHTGGIDLRFPHHEDERAQSNALVGHEVVQHWVHGEHLLNEGRKMAKSTGNVVLVSDVVQRGYDPLALRLFFLSGRYRQQLNLTDEALAAADKRLRRWRSRVAQWAEAPSKPMCAGYLERIYGAVDDDLDTPTALVALGELEKDDTVPPGSKFETFAHVDRLLGLDLAREIGKAPEVPVLPPGAQPLLDGRDAARAEKDWAASDALRAELATLGVEVTDTADGQTWTVTPPR
ncbi:MAG: cysteinyl-tRNA synthetase [Frankiales bacterium]|jgi:cysteinyl-tRNA synthetase|nr:cysteinyl-tRNA synthetase [Frankiales bacterium]